MVNATFLNTDNHQYRRCSCTTHSESGRKSFIRLRQRQSLLPRHDRLYRSGLPGRLNEGVIDWATVRHATFFFA